MFLPHLEYLAGPMVKAHRPYYLGAAKNETVTGTVLVLR